MAELKERVKGGIDDLAEKAKHMADQVDEKLHQSTAAVGTTMTAVKDKAKEAGTMVADAAVHAKDKAKEWAVSAADTAQHAGKEVTDLIRRYPVTSLLIGVGVGFCLAKALSSRS